MWWSCRDHFPARGAAWNVWIIALACLTVIPALGWRLHERAGLGKLRYSHDRWYVGIRIRVDRCRIEIPCVGSYPPPAEYAIVINMSPASFPPDGKITIIKMADIAFAFPAASAEMHAMMSFP